MEQTEITMQYGVVFEHADQGAHEDLVGPVYLSISEATSALLRGRASGSRGTIVQRVPGEEWTELMTGVSPLEWVQAQQG